MSVTNGPNLGLAQSAALGENWFADEKRTLRGLDGMVQCVVKDKDLAAPPGGESDGDMYIVAATATGDWVGKEGYIARYQSIDGTGYEFFQPKKGWGAYVQDEDAFYRYTGSAWSIPVSSGAQPLDADLTAIAALVSAANKMPYATGAGTWALADLTAAGRALLDDADAAAMRTTLGVDASGSATVADGDKGDITVASSGTAWTIDAGAVTGSKIASSVALAGSPTTTTQSAGDNSTKVATTAYADNAVAKQAECLIIALGDETTAITTGAAKVTFRMPWAMTLTAVRASLTTSSSSGNPAFDINESGASVLSTTLTIDSGERTSTTAATAAVISDASLADDAEITIDVDTAGTGAAGAKIYLIGTRT